MAKKFPFHKQYDTMDCGATCLRMIVEYHSKGKLKYSLAEMRKMTAVTREGVSVHSMSVAGEQLGLRPTQLGIDYDSLLRAPTPFIAHWKQEHFVVVTKITKEGVKVADPAHGMVSYSRAEFEKYWGALHEASQTIRGVVLLLEPTPDFYEEKKEHEQKQNLSFFHFISYVRPHQQLLFQLCLGLLMGGIFSFILPVLTQNVVDTGIANRNVPFIYLMLGSQLVIALLGMLVHLFKSLVTTHLSTRVSVAMLNDYISKLTRLPLSFFDSKLAGDIMQRKDDYKRIQLLVSQDSISTLFETFNLIVLSFMLLSYNPFIFLIFAVGSVAYVLFVTYFLKKRAQIDIRIAQQSSGNQNQMIQLVENMQEIKLNNCREQQIADWQKQQATTFKIGMEKLKLNETQEIGGDLITEAKNICISMFAAMAVVNGDITVGTMFAISAIVAQLNGPIRRLMAFVLSIQDAKLSIERISEIYDIPDEEQQWHGAMPEKSDIHFRDVSFRYDKSSDHFVLNKLSFTIPYGKTTAIVGASGSGKTTVLKLLLKHYMIEDAKLGNIYFGNTPIEEISPNSIRKACSTVMQDSKIFPTTIERNITISDDEADMSTARLKTAVIVADVHDFVKDFPLRYKTKIGGDGQGLSGGQRQRVLIARAIYRNPQYLFFDEATSALDTGTEKTITRNLNQFLKNKTAVIVAHRLSTVKNADQILVLNKGTLVESGTHKELVAKQGYYYELIKDQLELGN